VTKVIPRLCRNPFDKVARSRSAGQIVSFDSFLDWHFWFVMSDLALLPTGHGLA